MNAALYIGALAVVFLLGIWTGHSIRSSRALRELRHDTDMRHEKVLDALDHVLEGDLELAYEVLTALARERNAAAEVYFALAALLRARNQPERAAQVFRTILARPDLHRESADKARVGLARVLVSLGRGDDAKALLAELPKKRRNEANLLALRSEAAIQLGDWDGALSAGQALAKAEGGDSKSRGDVYNDVAEQAASRGDFEAAHRGFRKALKAEPTSVRAQYGLAQVYLRDGKTSKARRQLVATIQANPALFPLVLPELKRLMREEGDDEDSKFRELLVELGDREGLGVWIGLERADRLYRLDRLEEAQALLETVIHNHPRSLEAHEAYLNLLLALEDHKGLERQIEALIDLAAEEIRRFSCQRCGYLSAKPFMKCPSCHTVGSLRYGAG